MLLYMFSFFRSHDLTVRGAVQGSFRVTFGVASVFVNVFLQTGWGATSGFFFGVNLDFSGGIFDL